ncbi:uncharacterized protein G2W53_012620 [Senna tora]|uniref:RRM domain-containing protein n=1 Tax=Senna tora TaxID=362788 RepID=A0A834WPX7_9FABA|nr:uncharacterized protein G2W53_012620 [Senna tora]
MSSSNSILVRELYLFHKMERELYMCLVFVLDRDPTQSLLVMALWMWLEQIGHRNLIAKLLSLSYNLRNAVANEAVDCLECLEADDEVQVQVQPHTHYCIPLTTTLTPLTLHFFKKKRFTVLAGIKSILDNLCSRIFRDILWHVFGRVVPPGFPHPLYGRLKARREEWDLRDERVWRWRPCDDVMEDDTTMFLTFSRGFPVSQEEVEFLFRSAFGEDSVQLHMHQQEEQILFATLVVDSVATVDRILNGKRIAKFRINGKHIWARKYERRD